MNTSKTSIFIILVIATTFMISGCSSWSKTASGAVIGTGAGAAAGAVIGKTLGNTAAGAIAGAAVGGTVGAIIGRNMDRKAAELDRELEGVTIQRVEEGIAVSFDSGLLYGFDSATLRTQAQENLRKLAQIMSDDDDTILLIVGHTDSVGDENYNMGLSERRARSAANYMISQGLAESRVDIQGRGELEPIADNDTEAGRQENRRVEVAIYASPEYVERLKAAN
jgi:outer membrane protein OmpA-like peptidoglycan-associated protein